MSSIAPAIRYSIIEVGIVSSRFQQFTLVGVLIVAAIGVALYLDHRPPPLGILEIFETNFQSSVNSLFEERERLDETVWAQEVAAQKKEETIVQYWDRMLRPEDDKYAVLASVPFDTISFDAPGDTADLEWGITQSTFRDDTRILSQAEWRAFLAKKEREGYTIEGVEFHQASYEENSGEPAVSVFNTLLNIERKDLSKRWSIKTELRVEWSDQTDVNGLFLIDKLAMSGTTILEREGPTLFEHVVLKDGIQEWSSPIVYDLNRDGFSDIVLPSSNIMFWNKGNGEFKESPLFLTPGIAPPSYAYASIVADFTLDGYADLLCVGIYSTASNSPETHGVFLFTGDKSGRFMKPGVRVASPELSLSSALMCATAGDIDADGDLDVWLTQYKGPFGQGQMPTPFYNANDGFPSYLLKNRGDGTFIDVTDASGLASKRFRRTYSTSFIDLDNDLDLDLLVTSDFAGSDIYYNDGSGRFRDETESLLEETSSFGMGHTFGDFNKDGTLDFYVIGMGSTTMRRLNQMGLIRQDRPEFLEMRTRMGYGNRMYMGVENGFKQPEFKDNVARSG